MPPGRTFLPAVAPCTGMWHTPGNRTFPVISRRQSQRPPVPTQLQSSCMFYWHSTNALLERGQKWQCQVGDTPENSHIINAQNTRCMQITSYLQEIQSHRPAIAIADVTSEMFLQLTNSSVSWLLLNAKHPLSYWAMLVRPVLDLYKLMMLNSTHSHIYQSPVTEGELLYRRRKLTVGGAKYLS